MNPVRTVLLCLSLPISALVGQAAEVRTWTNREGKTVNATLESYDESKGRLVIKTANGNTSTIGLDQLCDADRAYLSDLSKKAAEEAVALRANAGKTINYKSDGAEQVSYHVYYPSSFDPGKPPAMIIVFSPAGSGTGMLNSIKSGCEKLGWIGVGCDTFRNNADEIELDKKWREVLPHIEKTVKHNPDLIYLGGMSGGALRAYDYSESTARTWKGVLAFGGWMGGKKTLNCPPKMAVAIVNGDKDISNSRIEKENAVREKAGCINKVFSFPGGHVVAPPSIVENAMQWLKDNTVPGKRMSKGKRSPTPEDPDLKKAL